MTENLDFRDVSDQIIPPAMNHEFHRETVFIFFDPFIWFAVAIIFMPSFIIKRLFLSIIISTPSFPALHSLTLFDKPYF